MRDFIRSCHPYAYRSGEWAEIITEVPARERPCWLIRFEDDTTDVVVQDDPDAKWEFETADEWPRELTW